jgi:hypothetical protein
MNNYHTRLKVYRQALSDYRWARVRKFFGIKEELYDSPHKGDKAYTAFEAGLCWYFFRLHKVEIGWMPELLAQKPTEAREWWFNQGELTPRIKVLKAAIKLTKQNMHLC